MTRQPTLASSAIVERHSRLLLIRRRNPPAADLFAFPGGRAEPGETPAETALRELFEETGLRGANPQLFATYDLLPESRDGGAAHHFFLSVFRVEADDDMIAEASSDAAEAGWYLPEEIADLPAPESVLDCVRRLVAANKGE